MTPPSPPFSPHPPPPPLKTKHPPLLPQAEEQRLREAAELAARIERARRKRLLHEKLQGAKLSEVAVRVLSNF